MINAIKNTLEKEFKANGITMSVRVSPHAFINNQPITYSGECYFGDGTKILSLRLNSERPFNPLISTVAFLSPEKLNRYCEIIIEAVKELEKEIGGF